MAAPLLEDTESRAARDKRLCLARPDPGIITKHRIGAVGAWTITQQQPSASRELVSTFWAVSAYDLLGGQHGPLRLLTRMVTYSIIFGIGYGFGLGLVFGVASGLATGITIAIELNRAAGGLDHYSWPWEGLFSAIRGIGFGAGLYRSVGLGFAVAFAILITVGQAFAYSQGMRPATDYTTSRCPRFSKRLFLGTVIRTIGYIVSALICSTFIHHVGYPWLFAIV